MRITRLFLLTISSSAAFIVAVLLLRQRHIMRRKARVAPAVEALGSGVLTDGFSMATIGIPKSAGDDVEEEKEESLPQDWNQRTAAQQAKYLKRREKKSDTEAKIRKKRRVGSNSPYTTEHFSPWTLVFYDPVMEDDFIEDYSENNWRAS